MNLPVGTSQDILNLVLTSGMVAKVVLAILLLLSIVSWAIIIDKLRVLRRVRKESERFLRLFQMRKSVREILQASRQFTHSPFAAVFEEVYLVLSKGDPDGRGMELKVKPHNSEGMIRLFDSVASREILFLEKYLVFLATTGSISPFVGLFGTVWGIMSAFLAIGYTGSSDLSVVAPGIAEALITTAGGLGAAIPAVIGYNYFVNKIKRLSAEVEIFYSNLIETFTRREVHEVE
jgi:biopolymer transport protein TolQ